jgi:adenylosuccinate synthase
MGSTKRIGPTYMDKTGRNGLRVGDIELEDFADRYRALADKHEAMIKFYDVAIQYNLEELEKIF